MRDQQEMIRTIGLGSASLGSIMEIIPDRKGRRPCSQPSATAPRARMADSRARQLASYELRQGLLGGIGVGGGGGGRIMIRETMTWGKHPHEPSASS